MAPPSVLSESLDTELDLIKGLGAAEKVSVLLVRPDADDVFAGLFHGNPETRRLSFAVAYEALQKRFDERVVQIEEFPEDHEKIRRIAEKAVAHISH